MPVKKNTDLIPVRPVQRINKVALVRDVVLTAVVTFFVVVLYIAHMQMVSILLVEGSIAFFLIWSMFLKLFVGESFTHMIYFNYVRKKKWK